jgi:hypothetical protein
MFKTLEEYKLEQDGILMYKNIFYVLDSSELKNLVLKNMHSVLCVGHLGSKKPLQQ